VPRVHVVLVFLGGGLGAALRFLIAGTVQERVGPAFPWGTFAVNALGCFAIGVLATWFQERDGTSIGAQMFWIPGVLGGFTTFSAFGLETVRLLEGAQWAAAFGNVLGSVAVCLAAVALGVAVGRAT
jgi:CrcB protein